MTKTEVLKEALEALKRVHTSMFHEHSKEEITDDLNNAYGVITLLESALSDDGWVKGNEPKESGWYFVFLNEEIYYDYYNKGGIWAKFDLPSSPEIIKQISHYKRMKTNHPKSK